MDFMNRITGLVLALVIGAILVGGLLIPSIEAMTTTEKTFENVGYYHMDKIASSDEGTYTIVWSSSDANILTINGTDMDVSTFGLPTGFASLTIFASETDIIRIGADNAGTSLNWVQIRGDTYHYSGASTSFNATITEGTVTADMDGTTRTVTYTDAYIIDDKNTGDYVMKKATTPAYMLEDTEYYGLGVTNVTGGYYVLKVTGTVDDADVSIIAVDPDTFEDPAISDITVSATAVNGYEGLYSFDKVTFTATGNAQTNAITYSYVIVPASVTAELSQHLDATQIAMFGVISLLGIIMLVVVAANGIKNKY